MFYHMHHKTMKNSCWLITNCVRESSLIVYAFLNLPLAVQRGTFQHPHCTFTLILWFMDMTPWSVGREFSHTHIHSWPLWTHTITQCSLKGDLIKPADRCNYWQPWSAPFSIVVATCWQWTESLCAIAAFAQTSFFCPLDARVHRHTNNSYR